MQRRASLYGPAVYGSVLAAALLGVMHEEHAGARTMTISLVGTMVVFWLAHAWSEVVGDRVEAGSRFQRSHVLEIARSEWPLVEAGLVPAALLALAWAGLWSRDVGVALALAAAILQLLGWGAFAAHRADTSWPEALLIGAVDGALGIGIVALEIVVH